MDTQCDFGALGPDTVLDALESVGFAADGRLLALNSYENRVYQVGMEEGPPVVVKFYRPQRWSDEQIAEEHAFVAELDEAEVPVVAAIVRDGVSLHHHAGYRFSVFPRRGGRAPELGDSRTREWLGRFIGRLHAIGATRPFLVRPALDIASFGEAPREYLLRHDFLPPDILPAWESVTTQALDLVRASYERAGKVPLIRLHGDCHVGNVLWTDAGPHFVDFDDSRTGPAVQDLWMLLSGERDEMRLQLQDVLAGYEDFCEFSPRELHLVEALRTLRLIHYAGWLASRWNDPAFKLAFPWFNTQRYWQDRVLELREQVALMQEPPLMAL
ncbi:serine/threonine protein kinase [Lacisediminimonas profundi]|uniref:serine/threonine protein kinase n=1 Tax=Lacisediminimonas profundi TaxID=2603856 RepID=UPI00124AE6CE|nr:serine/threonine protein kinase [Lacisediminimonas profundi]